MPLVPANQPDGPLAVNFANPLADKLIFAFCASQFWSSYRASALEGGRNMVYGQPGVFSTVPAMSGDGIYSQGKTADIGPGACTITWADPRSTGVSNGFPGLTLAAMTMNEAAWVNQDELIFSQRDSLAGVNRGIAMGNKNSPGTAGFLCETSDATAQFSIESGGGTQTQNEQALIVTVQEYNGDVSVYKDGVLLNRGASGLTLPLINGSKAFRAFNDAAAALAQWDGATAVLYAWNRALNPQEVAALHTDPYSIWRFDFDEEMMGMAIASPLSTYFLSF